MGKAAARREFAQLCKYVTRAYQTYAGSIAAVVFAVLAVAPTLFGAGVAYRLAHQSDERLSLEQHIALRSAIAEFRTLIGRSGEIDPRLIRALGLTVLVEGVETEHQRVLLRLAGCDEMQGLPVRQACAS